MRGYAFIEFEREADMRAAYKRGDGRKIDGRRVLVDVERGRTVRNWRPRRLGGGLGATRKGGDDVNQRLSGRSNAVGAGPAGLYAASQLLKRFKDGVQVHILVRMHTRVDRCTHVNDAAAARTTRDERWRR